MTEKLFVILEVERVTPAGKSTSDGSVKYIPIGADINAEWLWLAPERIIPASRLRYGSPKKGEMFWDELGGGFIEAECDLKMEYGSYLILDPPPEEKDEWDEWFKECPYHFKDLTEPLKHWLQRMPKRD